MSKKLRFNTVKAQKISDGTLIPIEAIRGEGGAIDDTTRDNRAFIVDANKIHQFLCRKNNTSQDAINRYEKRIKDNIIKAR